MDALRIKCNKVKKKKKGAERKQRETTSSSGQTFWTKGLGVGCPVDTHKHKHYFPRPMARRN